jgi:hypothetical protein
MTVFPTVFLHFFHVFSGVKIEISDFGEKNKGKKSDGTKRKTMEKREFWAWATFGLLLSRFLSEILKEASRSKDNGGKSKEIRMEEILIFY